MKNERFFSGHASHKAKERLGDWGGLDGGCVKCWGCSVSRAQKTCSQARFYLGQWSGQWIIKKLIVGRFQKYMIAFFSEKL